MCTVLSPSLGASVSVCVCARARVCVVPLSWLFPCPFCSVLPEGTNEIKFWRDLEAPNGNPPFDPTLELLACKSQRPVATDRQTERGERERERDGGGETYNVAHTTMESLLLPCKCAHGYMYATSHS